MASESKKHPTFRKSQKSETKKSKNPNFQNGPLRSQEGLYGSEVMQKQSFHVQNREFWKIVNFGELRILEN